MQLHSLRFEAIGPFRDRQHIDFAELGRGGLFLLDGATGAGKSTIIDAVVFALYGQVAGGHSSKHRLVSDHRELTAEPFVELVFETGRGIYRVRRTPEFDRPKKRGEGTVTQQASVKLWRGTSPAGLEGDPLSTRAGEADDEIRDAVGLSREQFVKTVVLPQGEFARFLQAKSDERRDILQSIFGTEHYEAVQAELRRRRVEARKACDEADLHLRYTVDSFIETSTTGHDAVSTGQTGGSEVTEAVMAALAEPEADAESVVSAWTDDIIENLTTVRHAADEAATAAETARADADAVLRSAEQRLDRRDRLRTALLEKETLEAAREQHITAERRLDAAQRAATCRSAIEAVDTADARLNRSRTRVQDLRATTDLSSEMARLAVAQSGSSRPGEASDDPSPEAVGAVHRVLLDTLVELNDVLQLEADLPSRRDEATTLTAHREKLSVSLASIEERLTELPARISTLEDQAHVARESSSGLAQLRDDHRSVQALITVHDELSAARQRMAETESARGQALRDFSEASESESDLRRRYLDGIAAELSEELRRGRACQVCGSTKHPRPARRMLDHVERVEVDAAESVRVERQATLDARTTAAAEAATAVAEIEAKLDGRSIEDLRSRLSELDTAIITAESSASELVTVTATIERHRQELDECRRQHSRAVSDIATTEARLATITEALDRDEKRVAADRHGFSTIAGRVADLKRRASSADQLSRALNELARHQEDRHARGAELERVLADAGFTSASAARAASLPTDEFTELRDQVAEWQRRRHAVEGRLADPDLAGTDPDEELDIVSVRDAFQARETELTEARRSASGLRDQLERTTRAAQRLRRAATDREGRYGETSAILRMAGLANADSPDNALRVPLATYVLQRVFDHVVDAANERLVDMSSGRYTLESHGGKQAGSRRSGLGLRIVDAHTGQARETETLSGGETFYVSLSLALGLADIVTSQAGGVQMGSLFIDEGFGSLDAETLDHVMGVLADLRSGGRIVGVVSHVEELKTRIPERIEVRRSVVGGPSTLTVIA